MQIKRLLVPTLNQPPKREILPTFELGTTIPKIIHQTYFSDEFPELIQLNVDNIRKLNPDWEYVFYNDASMISFIERNYDSRILELFQKINPLYGAARADVFRYLLMYRIGGVYLDIKSRANLPLSSVLQKEDKYIISSWEDKFGNCRGWGDHYELRHIPTGEYQQWYIACAPGHPFMKAVLENVFSNIEKYIPSIHGVGKPGVLRITGPIAYTLAIHPLIDKFPCRIVDSRHDLGLEYNIYQGRGHETVLKSHYSIQSSPVVSITGYKRPLSFLYGLGQFMFNMLKRR